MGTDAFQELDVFGLTLPIVKHSYIVRRVADLPEVVREAFRIAREGRPGPVLIDLPKDVQMADASHLPDHVPASVDPLPSPEDAKLADALAAIASAEKPVIYGGGGIGIADAVEVFRQFVDATKIPTVLTLRGLGALPANHPHYLGMLGMHGTRAANMAVQECDLLIVIGARFDDRATGKLAEFAPFARVLHVDADAYEIGKLRTANIAVPGDVTTSLRTLAAARSTCEDWRKRCAANRERFGFRYDAPGTDIYAPGLLKRLSEVAPADAIIACDVGQHQMWVAQHCKFTHPRNHLTSGALGTMGFGLPAAMGAQFACPDRTVILVNGDGGFMMNVQELATIARCKLPVKIVLIDNSALGMVRQWQELFFAERYSEIDLSDNPDFAALARVFGIPAHHISQRDEVEGALADLLAKPGPALLHVTIDIKANVWPLVPPNHANSSMLDANPAKQSAEPAVAAVDPEKKNALPA
ncbi:MAG: acetolactate synthase large subunit, partial [Pseudoxanthomonas sp.]|nr:acetolactate synthase large subunit [Pseudoxanthomonas sp.]